MATGDIPRTGGEDLRRELCNWLRLVELSGTREILLPRVALAEADSSSPGVSQTDSGGRMRDLASLRETVSSCTRCGLHSTRTKVVFGEGDPSSRLMFVGEGPGGDEDQKGEPFVGRAGMLLTRIIQAMGLKREDVYITNVVKCRPPGNRDPDLDEILECLPYLEKQVELVHPEVICTLGLVATQTITGSKSGISNMRGKTYNYKGIAVVPTFHPAACLRKPDTKKMVWEDIKKVMKILDLPIRGVIRDGAGKNKH